MVSTILPIRKIQAPEIVGPLSIYKHNLPEAAALRQSHASESDLFNGRLHEAHVIRLAGSYIAFSKNEPLPLGGCSDNYVGVHSRLGYVAVERLGSRDCTKRDEKGRCDTTSEERIENELALVERRSRERPLFRGGDRHQDLHRLALAGG